MFAFNLVKALIFIPLFFYFGYQLSESGFLYAILALVVFVGYVSSKMAAQSFPVKAAIIFPLVFYFGYKFAVTKSFGFVIWGSVVLIVYLATKLVSE